MTDPVRFRPHYLICALGFDGDGYWGGFTANTALIVADLRATSGDDMPNEVKVTADQ